jgi:hypothetical protein
MERQDRLLPTPMPPEEKQALRTKAKEDMLRGFGLLGTDILGAGGDISGLVAKYLPIAGGQTIDDIYKAENKPSEMLEKGIGSQFFQKLFDIKPTGSFGENLTRIGGSVVPISGAGIVNTLKTPKNIASQMRQSLITSKGDVLKMDDVPRTTGEILMTEGSGLGGIKPKPKKINIDTKIRDKDEITFGSALSADRNIYSRLVYDLENINKPGGISFPTKGVSAQDAINILSKRPTFAEAQESGLLAYLQRQIDKGETELVTQDDLLRVARAYKPNINKRVYSNKEYERLKKDTSWVSNMSAEEASKIKTDYIKGISNIDRQLPDNINLVATDFKNIVFSDRTEPVIASKLLNETYMTKNLKGLDIDSRHGYHDYYETELNPGYFGHIRNADVKLDPKLNDGLSDGVIAIEHQMNLAGHKEFNQSLLSLPQRVDSQKNKLDTMRNQINELDAKVFKSLDYEEKRLGRMLTTEELDQLDNYKKSPEFQAEKDKLFALKSQELKEANTLRRMEKQLQKGKDGDQVYDPKRNNEDFVNILTNEDRVLIDEIADIDKKNNIGLSTFINDKKRIIDDRNSKTKEVNKLYDQINLASDEKNTRLARSLKGDNAVGFLSRNKEKVPEEEISPFTVYDSGEGKTAKNPYFDMFVDAEKGGASEDFVIKLASNQFDGTPNNIIDFQNKTANMDLGFVDRARGIRKDNKELVSNTMKSEAKNYYETKQLTADLAEKIRNHPKFLRNFDLDMLENLKNRFTSEASDLTKVNIDLKIIIDEAIQDTELNLEKLATKLIDDSIKQNRRIPAFSPQLSKNPVLHRQQAIVDLVESITNPTIVRVPGNKQKVSDTGRPLFNDKGKIMELEDFSININSKDGIEILEAKLGKNSFDEEISFLEDRIKLKETDVGNLKYKLDTDFSESKFIKLSQQLRKKIKDVKLQDVFLKTMKHEAENFAKIIGEDPLYKNAPFPNLKKASQFLARSNIEQAIQDGKEFIAFPSRADYAGKRTSREPGEFESVFGKSLDEILKEYVKKGAVLKNQVISAADKATISNRIGQDPMRVLDIRPLLGKKKEAIPRMNKGGFFEKFRKAG